MNDMFPRGHADISACGRYRTRLTRDFGNVSAPVVFIMLNPSTADALQDDPTIRKCVGFAKRWGRGRLIVVNLFAYRATSPKEMMAACDPVGPENATAIERVMQIQDAREWVVCAWGANGGHMDQDATVMGWLDDWGIKPRCLGLTANGQPCHPLYRPYETPLQPFEGRWTAPAAVT